MSLPNPTMKPIRLILLALAFTLAACVEVTPTPSADGTPKPDKYPGPNVVATSTPPSYPKP